jgi:tRNA-modifying protein YgfZ
MESPLDLERVLGPRDVVAVEGSDALTYLDSQVSQDLRGMSVGEQRWTFLLEPTGKIEVLARVTRTTDDRFELDTDTGFGDALLARINRFKIRVNAQTSRGPDRDGSVDDLERIVLGWPRMGAEIVPGESIPAGTGLTGCAVSFTKGCYPGQELVERMDSRAAEAPRSLRTLTVATGSRPGDPLLDADGTEVGVLTSVSGTAAIAWVKRASDLGTVIQF